MFAGVVRTFVHDDDDNSRTMAALDRAMESGQRWSGILDDICRLCHDLAVAAGGGHATRTTWKRLDVHQVVNSQTYRSRVSIVSNHSGDDFS